MQDDTDHQNSPDPASSLGECIRELTTPVPDDPILGHLGNLPHHVFAQLHLTLPLLKSDEEELKKERGFSEALIRECGFRSCGPHVEPIFQELRKTLRDQDLVALGLMRNLTPAKQLTAPNVMIPYYFDGQVACLRPHKFGFKGVGVLPYIPPTTLPLLSTGRAVVLAESEFKAAAATQFGFPAIGTPGISVMIGQHFPRLLSAFRSMGEVPEIIVMFDSEEKTDPLCENYKPDPRRAWDTQYYAILHAERIQHELGIPTRIATLPSKWRVEGKIDIDGALAQGRTHREFEEVIAGALAAPDYRRTLPEIGRRIVSFKSVRRNGGWSDSNIQRTSNGYRRSTERKADGELVTIYDDIANFHINFVGHRQEEPGQPVRYPVELESMGRSTQVEWLAKHQDVRSFKVFVTEHLPGALWSGRPCVIG